MTKQRKQTSTVAAFIAHRLTEVGKTPDDIAAEVGLPNASMVQMLVTGKLKLPINLVSALAKALNVDATHLLRVALREYSPDLLEAIENVLQRPLISAREAALIDGFRTVIGDRDVRSVVVERDGLLEVIVLQES
jgi:transcriptional regulator with XRE-family HTH domain